MKKLMTMMLGLALTMGAVTAFAADDPPKKEKKKKAKKKKGEDKKS